MSSTCIKTMTNDMSGIYVQRVPTPLPGLNGLEGSGPRVLSAFGGRHPWLRSCAPSGRRPRRSARRGGQKGAGRAADRIGNKQIEWPRDSVPLGQSAPLAGQGGGDSR